MDKNVWDKCNEAFHTELAHNEVSYNYNEFVLASYNGSKEYAHLVIKNLILLNAGALAALPVIYEALNLNQSNILTNAAPFFIASLLCILITAFGAFFNLQLGGKSLQAEQSRKRYLFVARHFSELITEDAVTTLKVEENLAESKRKNCLMAARIFEFISIIFALISIAAFAYGAWELVNGVSVEVNEPIE